MRVFIGAAALCVMLVAAPTYAQATAPAQPAAPQPQAAPPPVQRPFPTGTKYAFVNIQRIAAESAAGKTLAGKVQALNQQKVNELNEKNKALQATQQKLDAGASVLSATAVAQLQKDIERQQIDIQRFTEDAQQDVTNLQTQLQDEFQVRLSPIIQIVVMPSCLAGSISRSNESPTNATRLEDNPKTSRPFRKIAGSGLRMPRTCESRMPLR